jgi:hypothetical protein
MKQEIGIYDRWIEPLEQHPSFSSSAQFALQDFIRDRDVLAIEREFYSNLLQALEDKKKRDPPRYKQQAKAQAWARDRKRSRK